MLHIVTFSLAFNLIAITSSWDIIGISCAGYEMSVKMATPSLALLQSFRFLVKAWCWAMTYV